MTSTEFFAAHLDDYVDELRRLVEIETPTGDLDQARRAAAFLVERLTGLGDLSRVDLDGYGPLVRLRRPGTGPRVVLLAHYDTVWPLGAWSPLWRRDDDRIRAPGVCDMKAGLLFIPWLLRWLDLTGLPHPHLEVLLTPDEEVGSLASRPHVQDAAAAADFALVLEPANLDGSLKLGRKGSGDYVVEAIGRAAHQGAEPENGVNAVVEAAHQVLRLLELQDLELGTTLGPNLIWGGTAANTVADRARIQVDVRAWTRAEQDRLDRQIRGLEPVLAGSRLQVSGRWNRPPMEATPASIELYERARRIASGLGLAVARIRWGGSSDANLAAAEGAITMDGLGPIGEGAHQPSESIVVSALPSRLALFSELVASLAEPVERWLGLQALAQLADRRR